MGKNVMGCRELNENEPFSNPPAPTQPHQKKNFLSEKMKCIKGAGKLKPVVGVQFFFFCR